MFPKSTLQMDFASIKFHGEKKKPYIGFNLITGIQHLQKKKIKKKKKASYLDLWNYFTEKELRYIFKSLEAANVLLNTV